MRKDIAILLIGVLTGCLMASALLILIEHDKDRDTVVLDYIIDYWTSEQYHGFYLSGYPAKVELPDAKPRYFPDTVKSLARRLESNYKIPYGITLSQYALESRWGLSNLGISNYFGHTYAAVKSYMSKPDFIVAREKVMKHGTIVLGDSIRFAKYTNIAECFETHGRYVSRSPIYQKAFEQVSPEKFATEISKRYATDPDYELKLISIMRRYNLN